MDLKQPSASNNAQRAQRSSEEPVQRKYASSGRNGIHERLKNIYIYRAASKSVPLKVFLLSLLPVGLYQGLIHFLFGPEHPKIYLRWYWMKQNGQLPLEMLWKENVLSEYRVTRFHEKLYHHNPMQTRPGSNSVLP